MLGFINKNKILTFFAVMAATQILLYVKVEEPYFLPTNTEGNPLTTTGSMRVYQLPDLNLSFNTREET